jgi:hypothetical protein
VTFHPSVLRSITIVPLDSEDTNGRFRVWLTVDEGTAPVLVWDRKVEGQFPELKVLVSILRSPGIMAMLLKREFWALRRNSGFGIISNLIGRLVTQTNEGYGFVGCNIVQ